MVTKDLNKKERDGDVLFFFFSPHHSFDSDATPDVLGVSIDLFLFQAEATVFLDLGLDLLLRKEEGGGQLRSRGQNEREDKLVPRSKGRRKSQ